MKLRPGQSVVDAEGEGGPLDLVPLDATTGKLSQLVVRRGGPLEWDTLVAAEWVSAVHGNQVVLRATREQLRQCPEYRTDDAITDAVQGVLWYRSGLPDTEVHYVNVRTVNGVVELSGYTRHTHARAVIEELVRAVLGVLDVRNTFRSLEDLSVAERATEHRGDAPLFQRQVGPE